MASNQCLHPCHHSHVVIVEYANINKKIHGGINAIFVNWKIEYLSSRKHSKKSYGNIRSYKNNDRRYT
jgi:hypothetical protein